MHECACDDRVVEQPGAMRDRTLITTGILGGAFAAICCATPLLAILFGAVGLTAWLVKADYVLIPAFLLCVMLVGFGIYRRSAGKS